MKKIKLNIGCGGQLAEGYTNVDAFLTEEFLRKCYKDRKEKWPKNTKYVQASIESLPFKDNSADYIELVDMIEHIPFRHLSVAFAELYRVLAPGGTVCVVTTNFDDVAKMWLETSQEFNDLLKSGSDISPMFDSTHRLDSEHGWGEVKKRKVNLVMSVIYGNQFHDGEYHRNAFTPYIMHIYMRQAGFEHDNIVIETLGRGAPIPKLPAFGAETKVYSEKGEVIGHTILINEIIVARATK